VIVYSQSVPASQALFPLVGQITVRISPLFVCESALHNHRTLDYESAAHPVASSLWLRTLRELEGESA
jgi:hypothetical protein